MEAALEDSRSINRLARLVEERLASHDYDKYFGLVAAVRAAFENLISWWTRQLALFMLGLAIAVGCSPPQLKRFVCS